MTAKIPIDWDTLESLMERHCTLDEIAGVLRCSKDTIERRIKEKTGMTWLHYAKQVRGRLNALLRSKQIAVALNDKHPKQVEMLKFLGQHLLNQRDKIEQDHTVNFPQLEMPDSQLRKVFDEYQRRLESIEADFSEADVSQTTNSLQHDIVAEVRAIQSPSPHSQEPGAA